MNSQAHDLCCQIEATFESRHHKASLKSLLSLFLNGNGQALPDHSDHKSASALSRFLNVYAWELRPVLRTMRQESLRQVWQH